MRIYFYLLLLLPSLLMAQNRPLVNFKDANGLKQGNWKVRHENSQAIRYTGAFKDDQPTGLFQYYYPTGVLSAIMKFSENKAYVTMYHENGNVMSVGKYLNQQKDSVWYVFSERNELLSSEDYLQDKIHGKQFLYYPVVVNQGEIKVMEMYSYDSGLKHGPWETYYDSGHLKGKGKYKNGYKQGEVFYYFSNGQLDLRGFYKQGEKNGLWTNYNEDGSIGKEVHYRLGKILKGKELEQYIQDLKNKNKPNKVE